TIYDVDKDTQEKKATPTTYYFKVTITQNSDGTITATCVRVDGIGSNTEVDNGNPVYDGNGNIQYYENGINFYNIVYDATKVQFQAKKDLYIADSATGKPL